MSFDRAKAASRCHSTAWAVAVGNEWFGGFGGRPPGPYIVKLCRHLADALLCVSPQKAADYVQRLEARGYPGARVVRVEVAE